ncbi:MAG TPA: electron transport complex subunit RsxE [Longimicrobiales bacterium]|nr:electron transport complex subunit RsxE [Longimicrobiales bacterium]
MRSTTPVQDFVRPLWRENPVLVQTLGMCPTMAITNTVINGVSMGLTTAFVLTGSSLFVSLLARYVVSEVRISSYILIIATFTTLADLLLAAVVPDIHKALGAFIPLIVANCILLGRQEAFAQKNPVGRSVLDALGTGFGFTFGLFLMSMVREILGNGSFAGVHLFGPNFEPWLIFMLPPGGFFTLGLWLLTLSFIRTRRSGKRPLRRWPNAIPAGKAAA